MIRIYDKEEKLFDNLGLGSLDETITAVVVEELNGSYEMEMEYPITGRHFDKLQLKNIIFCKPNMYTREQPFRIYSITKPIDGKVTVNAEHISYDASGITILPKRNTETKVIESFGTKVTHNDEEGYFLDSILTDIKAMSALPTKNYFNLIRSSDKENVFKKDGYFIPAPTNLRSMLGGDSGSVLEKFKGEYLFDRFDVILKNKRGVDRGLTIRYGKNMTDIEHESEGNNLFTAIFPFYSKNYTETQQTTKPIFQETYIIEGVTPLRADWLSIELIDVSKGIGGINLKPVVEVMKVIVDGVEDLVERYAPVRVKTPNDPENPSNDFYDKIYVFKRNTEEDDNLIKAYVSQKHIEQITVNDELKDIEVITELKLNREDVTAITPVFGKIYVIQSDDSEHYNRKMIWDNDSFVEYSSDGFYVEAKDATLDDTLKDLKPIPTYPIRWDEVNSKWIRDDQNGSIYVEPKKPHIGTVSVDKYVYVDLLEYELPEESNVLLENGVMYVNETLKNLSNQRILTLDLTDDLDSIDNLEPTDITSQHLFDKAEQYLKDNDLTKLKESITISFIKLSDSPEYEHLKALEIVELGDEVNVIYEELGINSKHRVIVTHYNVLTDSYDEIELGEKTAKITNNIVSSGDNVSSLKNDAEYTEKTYVVNFVAENANIINAEIQKAIIQTLEASNVNISGLLVASHATIDDLVSQMLVTDNAKISELLEAGSVRVKGKITALSGEIGGCKIQNGKLVVSTSISVEGDGEPGAEIRFIVDDRGNVTANSLSITGGFININDVFNVDQYGNVNAGFIKTKKIAFDPFIELKYKEDTQTESHNVTFTSSHHIIEPVPVGVTSPDIKVTVMASENLFHSRTINVQMIFEHSRDGTTTFRTVVVNIPSGSNIGYATFNPYLDMSNYWVVGYNYPIPSQISEVRNTGETSMLSLNSDFGPDSSGIYNLGDPTYVFDDVYTNNVINTSDKKEKKDIDYDISLYDRLFDKLKPVSYKFKNGKSGRTHLGFIAQDIGDSLDELDMDSKDFAGYIKSLKNKIVDKNKTEFTEEDYMYALRYSELHALEVRQIQYLKKYIEKLENRIKKIENDQGGYNDGN